MAIIGIDLGTTNSLVSVYRNGHWELIPNAFGEVLTPSIVALDEQGNIIVGKTAKERMLRDPAHTAACFKRWMGSDQKISLNEQKFTPEELSSFVLRKLVEDAETYLQETIEEAVISVPAYFNDDQRWATKTAGELAGIKVERLINEPSAAALTLYEGKLEPQKYLVVDFGGGTLDISVVDAFENIIEIVTVAGDNHLGGEDFTKRIQEDMLHTWNIEESSLTKEETGMLYKKAEELKYSLSGNNQAACSFSHKEKTYTYELQQAYFESLCKDLLERMDVPLFKALRDAKGEIDEIDEIFLVGGSSRMKIVQDHLQKQLGRKPLVDEHPDETIAAGCGIAAGIKARKESIRDILLSDICPFTLGTDCSEWDVDATYYQPIIERNTLLPCSREQTFYTSRKGQTTIDFTVYQGEHRDPDKNLVLGKMKIRVPRNFREHEAFRVRFTYDINGILEVNAIASDGTANSMIIVNKKNRMSAEQITQRLKELEKLKIHPREKEKNRYLLERGKRLFEDFIGEDRELVSQCLRVFERALESQDERQIDEVYDQILHCFNSLEQEAEGREVLWS